MTTATQASDIEAYLLNLEESFYQRGIQSGTPHGELHGLFEGRALGREKGWELWEEVGYYEGVARFWKVVLSAQGKRDTRAFANVEQVLSLVESFPTSNDSSQLDAPLENNSDVDIPALLTSIRSKYRTVCASLGVRARMVAAPTNGEAESIKTVGMSL